MPAAELPGYSKVSRASTGRREVGIPGVNEGSGAAVGDVLQAPCRPVKKGDQAVEAFIKDIGQGMGNAADQPAASSWPKLYGLRSRNY